MKSCPFCGGNAKVSHREIRYYGINYLGKKKKKIAAQVICNKCKARGPVVTETIIDPDSTGKKYLEHLCSAAVWFWDAFLMPTRKEGKESNGRQISTS